jgi:hypothetical protein
MKKNTNAPTEGAGKADSNDAAKGREIRDKGYVMQDPDTKQMYLLMAKTRAGAVRAYAAWRAHVARLDAQSRVCVADPMALVQAGREGWTVLHDENANDAPAGAPADGQIPSDGSPCGSMSWPGEGAGQAGDPNGAGHA